MCKVLHIMGEAYSLHSVYLMDGAHSLPSLVVFLTQRCLFAWPYVPSYPACRPSTFAVLDSIYSGYGESLPRGHGPIQHKIRSEGDKYLKDFPLLDYILQARIL